MRPKTGATVIGPACSQPFGMKGVDRGVRSGVERNVKPWAGCSHRNWLLLEREEYPPPGRP